MNESSAVKHGGRRFGCRDVVVVAVVVCTLLFGLAIPAVRMARDSARRTHCAMMLLQIGRGLECYHDVYDCFPPAFLPGQEGEPAHSWRVLLTPFCDCDPFYDIYDFGESWNGQGNRRLVEERAHSGYYFHCPADPPFDGTASYLAVVGEATAWPGPEPRRFGDFVRGMSHSILLVEQRNSGIHWMEPRDLEFDRLDLAVQGRSRKGSSSPGQAISSEHPKGAHALFADGSLEFLAAETSPEVLKDMLVIGGEEAKIPLGTRKRFRLVDLPPSETDLKGGPLKVESYTLDETPDPSQ